METSSSPVCGSQPILPPFENVELRTAFPSNQTKSFSQPNIPALNKRPKVHSVLRPEVMVYPCTIGIQHSNYC